MPSAYAAFECLQPGKSEFIKISNGCILPREKEKGNKFANFTVARKTCFFLPDWQWQLSGVKESGKNIFMHFK